MKKQKMKTLSIDTSSKICGVTIADDENVLIHLSNGDEKTHSVKLMPMIDEAFKSTNLTLDDINLLAVCTGPGSFTGVRIGIATIKAFSDAKHIPIVGVSSLESLAFNVALENTLVCSIIDAKNSNVYCGLYSFSHKANLQCTKLDMFAEDIDTSINKIRAFITNVTTNALNNSNFTTIVFVGDGSVVYKEKIENAFANIIKTQFADTSLNLQNSNSVALAGLNKYNKGDYGYSASVSPIYLKKSQAERALEEKIQILSMTSQDIDLMAPNFETNFDKFWNINTLKGDFANANSTYLVAKLDDEVVGFAGYIKICDEANIMNIVTKLNKRELGIGSKLLQSLISNAKEQNLKSITLEVNANNLPAINLYEKFGFERIGLRKKYYNNTDDAILMLLKVSVL